MLVCPAKAKQKPEKAEINQLFLCLYVKIVILQTLLLLY